MHAAREAAQRLPAAAASPARAVSVSAVFPVRAAASEPSDRATASTVASGPRAMSSPSRRRSPSAASSSRRLDAASSSDCASTSARIRTFATASRTAAATAAARPGSASAARSWTSAADGSSPSRTYVTARSPPAGSTTAVAALVHPFAVDGVGELEPRVAQRSRERRTDGERPSLAAEVDDEARHGRADARAARQVDTERDAGDTDERRVGPPERGCVTSVREPHGRGRGERAPDRRRAGQRKRARGALAPERPVDARGREHDDGEPERDRRRLGRGERGDCAVDIGERDDDPPPARAEPARRVREQGMGQRPAMEVQQ